MSRANVHKSSHPKIPPLPYCDHGHRPPSSLAPGRHWATLHLYNFVVLRLRDKWNHTIHNLWNWLVFTQPNSFAIYLSAHSSLYNPSFCTPELALSKYHPKKCFSPPHSMPRLFSITIDGNSLQYSCLENPIDRGAWQAIVHGVAKSRTWLSSWNTHTDRLLSFKIISSFYHYRHCFFWVCWTHCHNICK